MAEISEKERKRLRELRDSGKLKNEAASFRLGPAHIGRLREISKWRDMSQTDLLRQFIDKEHKLTKERREAVRKARSGA